MTISELTKGVQFTVNQDGQLIAVVIDPALWRRIVEALEDAEDRELARALRTRLGAGPVAAGALRWQDVADQWQ